MYILNEIVVPVNTRVKKKNNIKIPIDLHKLSWN